MLRSDQKNRDLNKFWDSEEIDWDFYTNLLEEIRRMDNGLIEFSQGFGWNTGIYTGTHMFSSLLYNWAKLINARNILEIGVGYGRTTYWLAHAAKELMGKYTGIDIENERIMVLREYFEKHNLCGKFFNVDTNSLDSEWFARYVGKEINLVFLDGNHKKETICHEMEVLYPLIARDGYGYVFVHDVMTESQEGWEAIISDPRYEFEHLMIKKNPGMGVLRKMVAR